MGTRTSACARRLASSLLLLLVVCSLGDHGARAAAAVPQRVAESLQAAEQAYAQERYSAALAAYREVLASGWSSASLYYNLGCAAQRAGRLGWAVAYLEEARRRAPRDPDIRHNLRIVSGQVRDRRPPGDASWVLEALAALLDAYAPADALRSTLAAFWLAALLLAVHWLLGPRARRITRRVLAPALGLLLISLIGLALKAYQVESAPAGVVVADEVEVRAGPRNEETVQFVVHAGTLLDVGRSTENWREVWLGEEMRGWVPESAVTEFSAPCWRP
ncbi:MAG: hypothetical protein KAY32_02795 [Candidatus Eisenbacteria sp.]|nr:hypothetical protein [Candidatus Eisenbacteria bacterium]